MPRIKSGNERINILIPPNVLRGLKVLAAKRGTTYSELMRIACREYLRRELSQSSPVPETMEG
jgi:metal-responsive CopG/Arc/MetJ family transcriptional regulator